MENGVLSSHDITKYILELLLFSNDSDQYYTRINLVCKLWKIFTQYYQFKYFNWNPIHTLHPNLYKNINFSVDDNFVLRWASSNGYTILVKFVLKDPRVNPSSDDNFALRIASKNGYTEIVRLLLEDIRVDPSAIEHSDSIHDNFRKCRRFLHMTNTDSALTIAAEHGQTDVVKILLENPLVDPSEHYNFALYCAVSSGTVELVQLLIQDERVDPSAEDNEAIRWASYYGYSEIVQLLLSDPRVDPSAVYNNAIKWASQNGHTEVVRLLLTDPRVDPSVHDNHALNWAIRNGHTRIVNMLKSDKRYRPYFVYLSIISSVNILK